MSGNGGFPKKYFFYYFRLDQTTIDSDWT